MIDFINALLRPMNLFLMKKRKHDAFVREKNVLESLLQIVTGPDNLSHDGQAECIIFSMDRSLQLHALLCSYYEKVVHPVRLHVLYRTSSPEHQKAYDEVLALFKDREIDVVLQASKESFKQQLLDMLGSIRTDKVFFLVDDDLFIEDVDMADFTRADTRRSIITLRLGGNLRKSYTVQKEQNLPEFVRPSNADAEKLYWIWGSGEYDWAYPLSVTGHLFATAEMKVLAAYTNFSSPNTFEANLQAYAKHFLSRYGICYKKARMMNIPINKVQNDNENIHGTVHQDYLLEQWNKGMQMNYRELFGITNVSAHQEVPITFIKRT